MKRIFVDPSYAVYENNKLFDATDAVLNRDDTLAPYIKFKSDLEKLSIEVLTFDQIKKFSIDEIKGDGYVSFGVQREYAELKSRGLHLLAFFILEPPLVAPKLYRMLPQVTKYFSQVFIHNTHGDCYSLKNVQTKVLESLYWPQPFGDVAHSYWSQENRKKSVVVINGNHLPRRLFDRELYSLRIKWAVGLNNYIDVDLFGRGWNKLLSRTSLWIPFLFSYFKIQKIYRGPCGPKLPLMSQYDFCLCFENLRMDGYITEKIFDCLYSGAIPIYRGGDDIAKRIPENCYIDLRKFRNASELSVYLLNMSLEVKKKFRMAGRDFLLSAEGQKFHRIIDVLKIPGLEGTL